MKPVAAYLRMSTDHQKYSLENQRLVLDEYAISHGMEIVETYSDAGKSGLSLQGREGLQSLLADAMAGCLRVTAILVLDISRWGRFQDTDEAAYYEFQLRRLGFQVIYCGEAFENDGSPTSAIIKSVKRAMAAEFSRELSRKVSAGLRLVASKGYRTGSSPGYGLRRAIVDERGVPSLTLQAGERKAIQGERTVLVPGPYAEVQAVQRAFSLFVKGGLNVGDIAKVLTEEGWPPPSAASWNKDTVWRLLRQEKYAGVLVFGRTRRAMARVRSPVPTEQWVRVEDAYQPIVSRSLFDAAQSRIRANQRSFTDQEIIEGIARVQLRYGLVTRKLLSAQPELPCLTAIRRRFGTLANALLRAGCPALPAQEKRRLARSQ